MNNETLDALYGHLIELEVLVSDANDCLAKNDDLEMLDVLAEIKRVAKWLHSIASGAIDQRTQPAQATLPA